MGLPRRAVPARGRRLRAGRRRSGGSSCRSPSLRDDGPLGEGSLQRFVDADFEQHYFTLLEDDEPPRRSCQRLCVFDIAGQQHRPQERPLLLDADGHIWGIDNGLCFHQEFKLRTVIWDFAGEPIPADMLDDVAAPARRRPARRPSPSSSTPSSATPCSPGPVPCSRDGRFPIDATGRRYPWPLV